MLLTIAWRNIWRNKRRSLIVLSSVAVGLVAILLNDGLSIGMVRQIFENQIGSHVSHIQIHSKGFNDNKVIQNSMTDPGRVGEVLARTPGIVHYSPRVVTYGLLSSAVNSSGCIIVGIDPAMEREVTTISRSVVEGTYLSGKRHEVVIGKELAEKLNVGLGDKVVGMASTMSGSVGADMFRVVGLFQTVSSEFDKSYMFISLENAQDMLEMGTAVSEFAIITRDRRQAEQISDQLASALGPSYEVLTYADIMPLMISQMRIYEESMYIVYVIVGLAMIFGIINTMLMSVFERIREFGVLMSIGMKNSRLVGMILMEAAVLGVVGAVVGLLAGLALIIPLSHSGLNLSMFSESLTSFGTGSVIYPVLRFSAVVESMVIIPFVAVIGAIYPALKAIRFEPVRAIRYV
jgi:putative ABC transport system permease protein